MQRQAQVSSKGICVLLSNFRLQERHVGLGLDSPLLAPRPPPVRNRQLNPKGDPGAAGRTHPRGPQGHRKKCTVLIAGLYVFERRQSTTTANGDGNDNKKLVFTPGKRKSTHGDDDDDDDPTTTTATITAHPRTTKKPA
jgi:hypothetical protein